MAFTKKIIFVTGATGYIGSYFLEEILKKNIGLVLLTRKKVNIQNNKIIKIYKCKDIKKIKKKRWISMLKGVDYFVHLAWYVNHEDYLDSSHNYDFYESIVNIANICKDLKLKKFIGIGSCLEYSSVNKPLKLHSTVKPKNLYTFYKIISYLTLRAMFEKSKTKFIWLRPFFLYGGNEQAGRLVPSILNSIKNKKKININFPYVIRDFLHIKSASKIMTTKIMKSSKNNVINICSGKGISIINFVKFFIKDKTKYKYLNFAKNRERNSIVGVR
jgi:dTDP-6-deoxy-L-talose 4-dehydrogenase (NAD+)